MKQYEWDEYYEKFNDWSFSTQKTYFNKLTSFGPSDEVTDVIESFGFDDEKVASRCLKRAIETGVKFTTDDVERLIISVDEEILSVVSRSAIGKYTKDQLEMLYGFIDDESFEYISRKANIDIFEDDSIDINDIDEIEIEDEPYIAPPKMGIIEMLFAFDLLSNLFGKSKAKHNGRCNGDCASCPPHYGYRYGRWYYGHHHTHGCVFGGNKSL